MAPLAGEALQHGSGSFNLRLRTCLVQLFCAIALARKNFAELADSSFPGFSRTSADICSIAYGLMVRLPRCRPWAAALRNDAVEDTLNLAQLSERRRNLESERRGNRGKSRLPAFSRLRRRTIVRRITKIQQQQHELCYLHAEAGASAKDVRRYKRELVRDLSSGRARKRQKRRALNSRGAKAEGAS